MPDAFQIENPPITDQVAMARYLRSQFQRVSQSIVNLDITGGGVPEAPIDGTQYGRQDASWTEISAAGGVPEAPIDGNQYGRQDASWTLVQAGAVEWGDITGNINLQTDMQNEFVNVTGDTMTGVLNVNRSVARNSIGTDQANANIELGGGTPYIDMKTSPATNFDWRITEIDDEEFRIQASSSVGKVWMYGAKWLDVGLATTNVERGVRLLNSAGSVLFANSAGAMRISQGAANGNEQEAWLTGEKNGLTSMHYNGEARCDTTTEGIIVRTDAPNGAVLELIDEGAGFSGRINMFDFFGANLPTLLIINPEIRGQVWIQSTTTGGAQNNFIFDETGNLQLPAEPNGNPDAATKLYVDNTVSDARLKDNVRFIDESSILNLNVYEFTYREHDYINPANPRFRPGIHYGVLADEVAPLFPRAVFPCPADKDEENGGSLSGEDYLAVDDTAILYLLLAEVKAIAQRLDDAGIL